MILWWSHSATLKQSPWLSVSSKGVPSQCQTIFRQILLWNKFCFPSELVCYFVFYNLSSLCSSLCRRSFSSSRSNMISHCVRYCSIGSSGNEVCKALMPPRSAPPYGAKKIKKKKKKKLPLLLSSKFKQQRLCYLKLSLRYFKA